MITAEDFYKVMCAMVPLYMAMIVAYGSVKWWKIFTADQCSGINRFVAVFAVPVLSFNFISQNNPYQMDVKFILADTLSKIIVLVVVSTWSIFLNGGLDWVITLFSVATLPNTLVMGIPLLMAMYGDFTQTLMLQLLVLQSIIWYTLLLLLFEYRAATILIKTQFSGPTAASITKIDLDNDVISLDGRDPLHTESETNGNGGIRLRIRRSTSESALSCLTPRPSNLSNAEIFSVSTTHAPFHGQNNDTIICNADLFDFGYRSGTISDYASSDAYSLQLTPRESNFNELENVTNLASTPYWVRPWKFVRQSSPEPVVDVRILWGDSPAKGQNDGCGGNNIAGGNEISRTTTREETSMKVETEMPRVFIMARLILTLVGRKLCRNPNSYSSILALLWSLISFKWNVGMPSLIKDSIKIISDAGLGMAMFSLGLFMGLQPGIIMCGKKRATMAMAIRFICGPIVMATASFAVGLRGVPLHAAIVQAALPQGIVPFVFAREYGLHPDILSTGVIFGMLVSLPVTLLYYIFLGL